MNNAAGVFPTSTPKSNINKLGNKLGTPKPASDQSGVVGGITVIIMTLPLLLISVLVLYNHRLSQTDHNLNWSAMSAARAGAHCLKPLPESFQMATQLPRILRTQTTPPLAPQTSVRPCTLREVAEVVEVTIRSQLLDNRRLLCRNSSRTGMRLEYLDSQGSLIYAYTIGSILFDIGEQWPDNPPSAGTNPLADDPLAELDNPQSVLFPGARVDIAGNSLTLEQPNENPTSQDGTTPQTNLAPQTDLATHPFESSMATPLGQQEPVARLQVQLTCLQLSGSGSDLLPASNVREASAIALVPESSSTTF